MNDSTKEKIMTIVRGVAVTAAITALWLLIVAGPVLFEKPKPALDAAKVKEIMAHVPQENAVRSEEIPADASPVIPRSTDLAAKLGFEAVQDEYGVTYVTGPGGDEHVFGDASFYDYDFDKKTGIAVPCAGPHCYTNGRMFAASRHFKRFSTVRVTNLNNGKFVDVLITDFGPDEAEFPERVIDLTSSAFGAIADRGLGVIPVRVDWPAP